MTSRSTTKLAKEVFTCYIKTTELRLSWCGTFTYILRENIYRLAQGGPSITPNEWLALSIKMWGACVCRSPLLICCPPCPFSDLLTFALPKECCQVQTGMTVVTRLAASSKNGSLEAFLWIKAVTYLSLERKWEFVMDVSRNQCIVKFIESDVSWRRWRWE